MHIIDVLNCLLDRWFFVGYYVVLVGLFLHLLGNIITGRIGESVYLGEVAQYEFHAGAGMVKVFELNPRFVETGHDQDLHASVSPEDVVVLTR